MQSVGLSSLWTRLRQGSVHDFFIELIGEFEDVWKQVNQILELKLEIEGTVKDATTPSDNLLDYFADSKKKDTFKSLLEDFQWKDAKPVILIVEYYNQSKKHKRTEFLKRMKEWKRLDVWQHLSQALRKAINSIELPQHLNDAVDSWERMSRSVNDHEQKKRKRKNEEFVPSGELSRNNELPPVRDEVPNPALPAEKVQPVNHHKLHCSTSQPVALSEASQSKYLGRFNLSIVELLNSLLVFIKPERECRVERTGCMTIRVDPLGRQTGLLLEFRGQTAKNLAKRATSVTSEALRYFIAFGDICDHIKDLVSEGETFDMLSGQGFATLVVSPDFTMHTALTGYFQMIGEINKARSRRNSITAYS